jgi:hypothetical protein
MTRSALAIAAAVAGSAVVAAPAAAQVQHETILLSRSASGPGGFPNGPSTQAAISHDKRTAVYAAYTSTATNIVAGTTPGLSNVFLVKRAGGYGVNGTPWAPGQTTVASVGVGGGPANGSSRLPAFDGSSRTAPTCLAFISAASNLVKGDTNGQADAFIRDLRTGTIRRLSVNSKGVQANGPTTEVVVDGRCTRAAFVSSASNLAQTARTTASSSGGVTSRPAAGLAQVYVRFLGNRTHFDQQVKGLTFLASASDRRKAGNGASAGVAISRNGKVVTFGAVASNLTAAGSGGHVQVFARTITPRLGKRVHGRSVQTFLAHTILVSRRSDGGPGNGASATPTINAGGTDLAFSTRATDLLAGNTHGVTQIAHARLNGDAVTLDWVSSHKSGDHGLGTTDSLNPSITDGGASVFYDTPDNGLKDPEDHTAGRAIVLGRNYTVSRDSRDMFIPGPNARAATSPHENYVLFESPNLFLDRDRGIAANRALLTDFGGLAAYWANPANTQVYLRYLGPQ